MPTSPRDRFAVAAGWASVVALPLLLALKYGVWVLGATAAAAGVVALLLAGAARRDRALRRRPGVTVGGVPLGPLLPGVADHNGKHCDGDPACPLHDPSGHHLSGWPVRHGAAVNLTVRECPHGQPHPDPDDARWGPAAAAHAAECDGCCTAP